MGGDDGTEPPADIDIGDAQVNSGIDLGGTDAGNGGTGATMTSDDKSVLLKQSEEDKDKAKDLSAEQPGEKREVTLEAIGVHPAEEDHNGRGRSPRRRKAEAEAEAIREQASAFGAL